MADPVALLQIGIAGLLEAPVITVDGGAILSIEHAPGHDGRFGLKIRLDPRFDDQMARMTQGRDGDTVVIAVCGQEMLRATLRGVIPTALFTLSLQDRAIRWRIRAALEADNCAVVAAS